MSSHYRTHAPSPTTFQTLDSDNDDEMDLDELEDEPEQEIDQLESSSESQEEEPEEDSESKGMTRAAGRRTPGQTLLPQVRVENILAQDGGYLPVALSKEAQYLVCIATEEFVKRMAQAAQREAGNDRRSMVSYRDIACSTQQYQEFMFLKDTCPQPISLAEALERRDEKDKEMLANNPAVAHYPPDPSPYASLHKRPSENHHTDSVVARYGSNVKPAASASSRAKGKGRATNGHAETNGSASAGGRRKSEKERKPRKTNENATSSSRAAASGTRTSSRRKHGRAAGEEARSASVSGPFTSTPQVAPLPPIEPPRVEVGIDPLTTTWSNGGFKGPSTNFNTEKEKAGSDIVSSSSPPQQQNSGRTIYSQHREKSH